MHQDDNGNQDEQRHSSPVIERGAQADPSRETPADEPASEEQPPAPNEEPDVSEDEPATPFDPTPQPTPTDDAPAPEDAPVSADEPAQETPAAEETPAREADEEPLEEAAASEPEEVVPEDVAPEVVEAEGSGGIPLDEADVADMLSEIGEIADECGLKSLAHEIENERLPALRSGRITLVVLGEFNHGKSTVVNALLGDHVLPVGITPTTAVITHLVHADEPSVIVKPPHGGESYTIPYEGMEQAVKDSGDEGEEPEYIEIGYPNEVLGNSLVLVDTPGVNDISRQKVEITYGYLPRADVILYVLDATQVLKKSEVTFIRDRLLKANRDRIIFVLNKVDALSPEDIEEVESYARERLQSLLGQVELFAFSGRQALDAQMNGGEPAPAFADFQKYLLSFLQEQRAYIILDSSLAGGARVAGLLEQNLAIKRQGYHLEKEELERRITAVRSKLKESRRLIAENTQIIDERITGIAATAKHNLRVFTEQFTEQLPVQIERAEASDVKKYMPTWIQESFKEWLESEGQELARNLEELAEEIIQITNESLQDTVESYRDEFGLSAELDLEVDTVAYDVGVFALGAFGVSVFLFANVLVGSLLTLATPVLAYFFKEKTDMRVKERAREQGLAAIDAAHEKLEEELLRVIHDYGARLKEFVDNAGDRLYRQIEEALEQVQEETAGDVDRDQLLAEVNDRLDRARQVGKLIKTSRTELGEWAVKVGY